MKSKGTYNPLECIHHVVGASDIVIMQNADNIYIDDEFTVI